MPFEPPEEFHRADWFQDARLRKIDAVVDRVNPRPSDDTIVALPHGGPPPFPAFRSTPA